MEFLVLVNAGILRNMDSSLVVECHIAVSWCGY